ncbi:MAG: hypothetical protein KF861_05070 [Planctomycetaceae bacterium]|nr:hypothetical protein [Planctomycetaceae bacterium]
MAVYVFYMLGGLIGLVTLGGILFIIFFLCGSVGVDGLLSLHTPRGELTCWHCGEQTRAGLKQCTHCQGELQ